MFSAWWLLLDANQPSGDPFFENTDLNVSSHRKLSFTENIATVAKRPEAAGEQFCLGYEIVLEGFW